jgi:hypothetical protein
VADLGELKIPAAMRPAAEAIMEFGVAKSTLSAKAKQIRDLTKMSYGTLTGSR